MKTTLALSAIPLALTLLLPGCSREAPDFTAKPRTAQTVDLDGLEVTLEVPEGLKEDPEPPLLDARYQAYDDDGEVEFSAPIIELVRTVATSTDDAKQSAQREGQYKSGSIEVASAEDTELGLRVTGRTPDDKMVLVDEYTRLADGTLHCRAKQGSTNGLVDPDAVEAMLTEICSSLEVPASALAPKTIAPMTSFMAALGPAAEVSAALAKFGVEGLKSDMGAYDLSEPEIVSTKAMDDGGVCYEMRAKAGMTVRKFAVCWAPDEKIVAAADQGIVK